jgi:hypothetical protein
MKRKTKGYIYHRVEVKIAPNLELLKTTIKMANLFEDFSPVSSKQNTV